MLITFILNNVNFVVKEVCSEKKKENEEGKFIRVMTSTYHLIYIHFSILYEVHTQMRCFDLHKFIFQFLQRTNHVTTSSFK